MLASLWSGFFVGRKNELMHGMRSKAARVSCGIGSSERVTRGAAREAHAPKVTMTTKAPAT